jgi:hypothetical protein
VTYEVADPNPTRPSWNAPTSCRKCSCVHTVNHVMDLDVGGSATQSWLLGAVSVLLVGAFALRARQLGYVLDTVTR